MSDAERFERVRKAYALALSDFLEAVGISESDVPLPPSTLGPGTVGKSIAAALRNPKTGRLELRYPTWGIARPGTEGLVKGPKVTEVRAESAEEIPLIRESFQRRRCILPMRHYQKTKGRTIYQISLDSGLHMGVAGVWEYRKLEGIEKPFVMCAPLNVPPNALLAQLNQRMPAILHPSEFANWLDPSEANPRQFLKPYDPEMMRMTQIGERAEPRPKVPKKPVPHGFGFQGSLMED